MLFSAHTEGKHANQAFFHVSPVPENISLQCGGSTENAAEELLNYLKPKHVKIRSFYLAICSKWERNCLTKFSGNCADRNGTLTKSRIFNVRENFAKTNQTVSLCVKRLTRHEHKEIESADPVGADKNILFTTVTFDYFALMFADIPVLYFLQPAIRDCVVNGRIISTRNLEVLVRRSIYEQSLLYVRNQVSRFIFAGGLVMI